MHPLRLVTSSSQRRLMAELAANLQSPPPAPLEPETVVVLSNGMARWISMELASAHGVSAGLDFSFPNDLLDRCFRAVLPAAPSSAAYQLDAMTWRIAAHLPTLSRDDRAEALAAYLGDTPDDRHLLQLSRAVAECFDQYTIFRPETVIGWDNGAGDDWQAHVWRAISADCPGSHRAALLRRFGTQMASGRLTTEGLPRRISLFGISYLPPFHLEALRLLSGVCQVTCYLLNPCGHYWGTIVSARELARLQLSARSADAVAYYETGNPLLSSLGTLGQEFFESLLDYGFDCQDLDAGQSDLCYPAADTPPHASLLATIQSDILNLHDRTTAGPKLAVAADDQSLQIHSCHGPLREMEVLYDQLLALFDTLDQLEPRQIVVSIPAIERYAPFITAVFGARSGARPALPFTIADRSIRSESPFVDAFLALLDLPGDRYGINRMLELLETPAIMARFDISRAELADISDWLQGCGVRWGLDAGQRTELGFPPFADFSWQAGLDRLFLGYALAPDGAHVFNSILPYPAIEGRQATPLGKLAEFIHAVRQLHGIGSSRHTLAEWDVILGKAAETLLLADREDREGPAAVLAALASLHQAQFDYGFDRPLGLAAVRDHLIQQLSVGGGGYGFMGGAITFCAMLPMRSIPMRVICLAGMNDGEFPRTARPPGFSLMSGTRCRGDRSLRDEDRYLFLEALMSAEECLYISYNGQGDRDNSRLPPSVVVSELQDYISAAFVAANGTAAPHILTLQRLQGFSPAYFSGSKADHLFSYDRESCRALEARRLSGRSRHRFLREPLSLGPLQHSLCELQQLRRFLDNPAALFLEQRTKVRPYTPAAETEEREPFTLDGLTGYSLTQKLIDRIQQGVSPGDCYAEVRALGILPPLSLGQAAFDAAWDKSSRFAEDIAPWLGEALEPLNVQLESGDWRLHGTLERVQRGTHLRWRCASMKGKDHLAIWIDHLLLNAQDSPGYPRESVMVTADLIATLPPIDNALQILTDLISLYRKALTRPLPFFPQASWLLQTEGMAKAQARWNGSDFSPAPPDSADAATAICFGDQDPLGTEFCSLSEQIFAPYLAVVQVHKR